MSAADMYLQIVMLAMSRDAKRSAAEFISLLQTNWRIKSLVSERDEILRTFLQFTAIVFVSDQPLVPPQQRRRRHDRGHLGQKLASESFGFGGQPTPLVIREPQPSFTQLFAQNTVLHRTRLGRTARESVPPAGRGHARSGARQPARRRARAGHLRSRAQSAVSRLLQHYGAVALPCRVRDPDRKGKVESGVGHAKKTPLKGLRFESLEEAQAYLDRWEERWADTRIHGTTKRQVAAMFAEEKPCAAAAAAGAVSLLPVRRAHGASGWLRGSRGRLLQRAAGLDRPPRSRAVG